MVIAQRSSLIYNIHTDVKYGLLLSRIIRFNHRALHILQSESILCSDFLSLNITFGRSEAIIDFQ